MTGLLNDPTDVIVNVFIAELPPPIVIALALNTNEKSDACRGENANPDVGRKTRVTKSTPMILRERANLICAALSHCTA